MSSRPLALAVLISLGLSTTATAAESKWDVNAAHAKGKVVSFSTDEGTWLDLDVSPDGRRIVFSMLGDIYSLPITGGQGRGEAKREPERRHLPGRGGRERGRRRHQQGQRRGGGNAARAGGRPHGATVGHRAPRNKRLFRLAFGYRQPAHAFTGP